MRKQLIFLVIWLFASTSAVANAGGKVLTVVDDTGSVVSLDKPAQRIVSLAPHTTEMLFAVGAGDKVVGAVEYSDYPEAAKSIPRVGGYSKLDIEAVLVMKPDLVVAWSSGNQKASTEKLKQLGLTVYFSEPKDFEGVVSNMERFAVLTGNTQQGVEASAEFRNEWARLESSYGGREKVRVFYQIWNKPLMTISGNHLIGKVIEFCGGDNIFRDLPVLAPQVDVESVILANPEAIIVSGMGNKKPEWLDEWRKWTQISAVKTNSIYNIRSDIIQRHSPRILQGAEQMCRHLDQVRKKSR